MLSIEKRIEIAEGLLTPVNKPLNVEIVVVDGFDPEDDETIMHTTTSMSQMCIVVTVFKGSLEKSKRDPYSLLKHEYVHVSQIQNLFKIGGWKLVQAANAYERIKWAYYDRPSEREAYGEGLSRKDFLQVFETEEFKRFFSIIDAYNDERVTFKGECSIVVCK